MQKPQQIPIEFDARWSYAAQWERVLELLNEAVDRLTLKEAAYLCDVAASRLDNALKGRDRHVVHASWLITIAAAAPSDDLVRAIAAMRGLDLVPAMTMTPEQRLAAYERELPKVLGPDGLARLHALVGGAAK